MQVGRRCLSRARTNGRAALPIVAGGGGCCNCCCCFTLAELANSYTYTAKYRGRVTKPATRSLNPFPAAKIVFRLIKNGFVPNKEGAALTG